MKEKRRLEMFLETHEITTISFRRRYSATGFCQTCQAGTLQLSVSEAASILTVTEFAMFHLVETGQVHSSETGGMIRVCGRSLPALKQDRHIET